jgi:CheY-like chemotaxis protein
MGPETVHGSGFVGVGVRRLREHGSDVAAVILDMMTPHMQGREVLSETQESEPHVPVVVSSGFSEESDGAAVTASSHTVCFARKPR